MDAVFRSNFAEALAKPVMTDEGWLRVDCYLTRSGVFDYEMPDGTLRREYRPPEEVFHPDALESFRGRPVTNDHPPVMLDSTNTGLYMKGHIIGDTVRREGNKVRASLFIVDAELIADIADGKREVSQGYWCAIDATPGVSPEGERYDVIQRRYKGNHAAAVKQGRAGKDCAIRWDGHPVSQFKRVEVRADKEPMMKFKIAGIDLDVPEPVAQAIEKERADAAAALAKVTADHSALRGELVAANAKADKAEKALVEATDPKKFDARVAARSTLVTQAEAVGVKCDGAMTDRAIKVAVIKALVGEDIPETEDDGYVRGCFDRATKDARNGVDGLAAARTVAANIDSKPPRSVEQARTDRLTRQQDAWRRKGA